LLDGGERPTHGSNGRVGPRSVVTTPRTMKSAQAYSVKEAALRGVSDRAAGLRCAAVADGGMDAGDIWFYSGRALVDIDSLSS